MKYLDEKRNMYHYTHCGLDNVWLENGFTVKNTPYGKGVAIEDAAGLHQVLALDLTKKKGSITGKELKFLRVVIGLSQEGLGRLLGATEQSVSLWERTGKVPKNSDSLTRMLVSEKLDANCKVTEVIERINTACYFSIAGFSIFIWLADGEVPHIIFNPLNLIIFFTKNRGIDGLSGNPKWEPCPLWMPNHSNKTG